MEQETHETYLADDSLCVNMAVGDDRKTQEELWEKRQHVLSSRNRSGLYNTFQTCHFA